MTEPASNYVSLDLAAKMRKQAIRVWMAGFVVVTVWALLILVAPLAKANGFVGVSSPLYHFFSYMGFTHLGSIYTSSVFFRYIFTNSGSG